MARLRAADPAGQKAVKRAWYLKNQAHCREYWRRHTYGLDPGQFDRLLDEQGNRCPICRQVFTTERPPVIDHDHTTHEIRGLIHSTCNMGIGLLTDMPDRCDRAAAYLRGFNLGLTPGEVL